MPWFPTGSFGWYARRFLIVEPSGAVMRVGSRASSSSKGLSRMAPMSWRIGSTVVTGSGVRDAMGDGKVDLSMMMSAVS